MRVTWMNDAASESLVGHQWDPSVGAPVAGVIPMAEALGVPGALAAVAATGIPQHLRADVITTGKGSMALIVSVQRLPDGAVLVLAENSWVTEKSPERAATRRTR